MCIRDRLITADWCPACPPIVDIMKRIEQDIELKYWAKLNFIHIISDEENKSLASEYLIGGFPTILIRYKDVEFTLIDELKEYKIILKYIVEFLKLIEISK